MLKKTILFIVLYTISTFINVEAQTLTAKEIIKKADGVARNLIFNSSE